MRIAHISDIHVKDRARDEYAEVFSQLIVSLKTVANIDAIAIAGDIFDTMTRASANNWEDVANLFEKLSLVAPLVVIPGNHDMNVRAGEAPNLIGPLLTAAGGAHRLQTPRVQYWSKSGVYHHVGAVWVVAPPNGDLPTTDDVTKRLGEVPNGTPVVGLYHETVGGVKYANGVVAPEGRLSKTYLSNIARAATESGSPCNILLGDVHLQQEVPFDGHGDRARAWYSGSLVCQGFGESHLGHGWLLWEIGDTIRVTPQEVPNSRAPLTIVIRGGRDVTPEPRPTAPRAIRIRHDGTTPEDIASATVAAEEQYGLRSRSIEAIYTPQTGCQEPIPDASLGVARAAAEDWSCHESFIREFLKADQSDIVTAVVERHRANVARALGGRARPPRVELLRLEFSNLYCYGVGNVVDFGVLRDGRPGLAGLVARNRAGKSALFDILTFALCDTTPRGSKQDITRRGAASYSLRLTFRLDAVEGRVEKTGRPWKREGHRTIRLWLGGEELTEKTTPKTARRLRELVGDPVHIETVALMRPAEITGRKPFALQKSDNRRVTISGLLRLGVFDDIKKDVDKTAAGLRAELRGLERAVTAAAGSKFAIANDEDLAAATARALVKLDLAVDSLAEDTQEQRAVLDDARASWVDTVNRAAQARAAEENARVAFIAVAKDEKTPEELAEETISLKTAEREVVAARKAFDNTIAGPSLDDAKHRYSEICDEVELAQASWETTWPATRRPQDMCAPSEPQFLRNMSLAKVERLERAAARRAPVKILEAKINELKLGRSGASGDPAKRLSAAKKAAPPRQLALAKASKPQTPDHKLYENLVRKTLSRDELADLKVRALEAKTNVDNTPVQEVTNLQDKITHAENLRGKTLRISALLGRAVGGVPSATTAEAETAEAHITSVIALVEKFRAAKSGSAIHQTLRSRLSNSLRPDKCSGCKKTYQVLGGADADTVATVRERLRHAGAAALGALARAQQKADREVAAAEKWARLGERKKEAQTLAHELAEARRRHDLLNHTRRLQAAKSKWECARMVARELEDAAAAVAAEDRLTEYTVSLAESKKYYDAAALARAGYEMTRLLAERSSAEKTITHAKRRRRRSAAVIAAEARLGRARAAATARAYLAAIKLAAEAKKSEDTISRAAHQEETSLAKLAAKAAAAAIAAKGVKRLLADLAGPAHDLRVAEAYRRVLNPKRGLATSLLENARSGVEAGINDALRDAEASFHVALSPEYELELVDNTTQIRTPPALGSGYQQFVLDLAARAALAAVAQVPLPACFLIDEGFGCLDETNLPRIAEALAALASTPANPLVLAVTHREDLLAHFVHHLVIETSPGKPSRITWPAGAEPAQHYAGPANPETLKGADPTANSAVTHCTPCGTEIRRPRWARHVDSRKHQNAVAALAAAENLAAPEADPAAKSAATYCAPCGTEIRRPWWTRHVGSRKHQTAVAVQAAAENLAATEAEAELVPPGRIRCRRCGSEFTPGRWEKHAASAKHVRRP